MVEIQRTERNKRAEEIRKGSRSVHGLREGLIALAAVGVLSCNPTMPQAPPAPSAAPTQQTVRPSIVLQGGKFSAGQIEIGMERLSGEPPQIRAVSFHGLLIPRKDKRLSGEPPQIRAVANLAPRANGFYHWFIYQDIGNGKQYILNPSHDDPSAQRYVGVAMRDVTLTDGRTGDFVVWVYGNRSTPPSASEWDPVVEPNGMVRPANVLFELRRGTLEPVITRDTLPNLGFSSWLTTTPVLVVPEYGPTIPVLVVLPP